MKSGTIVEYEGKLAVCLVANAPAKEGSGTVTVLYVSKAAKAKGPYLALIGKEVQFAGERAFCYHGERRYVFLLRDEDNWQRVLLKEDGHGHARQIDLEDATSHVGHRP